MRKIYGILFFSLLLFASASAQTNQWTWVSGDNIPNQAGIYGTKGVPSTTNKPGARSQAVNWKDAEGNLWLFGGSVSTINGDLNLNDLWKFNTSTNEWTWVSGDNDVNQTGVYGTKGIPSTANRPGPRTEAVSWTDAAGNFWLFGGVGYSSIGFSFGVFNDLWKYNPSTNEWTWVSGDNKPYQSAIYGTKGIPSTANRPGPRTDAVSWTDAAGNLWLFGGNVSYWVEEGVRGFGLFNELWKFNPATNEWTWVNGDNASPLGIYGTKGVASTTNKPGGRTDAVSWTDAGGNLWLFGGRGWSSSSSSPFSISGHLNDLWKFNPSTNEWTWVSGDNINTNHSASYGTKGIPSTTNKPGGRTEAVSWTDAAGNLWLFGGGGYDGEDIIRFTRDMNELWKFNPSTGEWTWVSGDNIANPPGIYGTKGIASANNNPGARREAVSWNDAGGNLWLFGGAVPSNNRVNLNDLWRFTLQPSSDITLLTDRFTSQYLSVCAGSQVPVAFTSNYTFNDDNVFSAYLSTGAGSNSSNKIGIGSIRATNAGTPISVTIPANMPEGEYTIQVESSSPAVLGTGASLSIRAQPKAVITASGGLPTSGGLSYKYYEGVWTSLPDFGALRPVATGSTANVSLAPRKKDDNFGFLWEGFITVPAAGTYFFETASDDGSRLYIGEYGHYVTPVVNNDGQHAEQVAGGSYTFPAAGTYPIAITYFEAGGAETMKVYWTAPQAGIPNRTEIPDAAFSHINYNPASPSLTYKYYEGNWTKLPNFSELTPVQTGTVGGVDISPKRRDYNFAFLWEGKINIPKAGTYYFETRSDDGSKLYIGDYGHLTTPVVNNDGLHAMLFTGGWYTFPAAGAYPIAITFFEATGDEGIEVYWTAPHADIHTRTLIPNRVFMEEKGQNCSPEGVVLTASEGESFLWSTGETSSSIKVYQNGSYTVQVMKDGCYATSAPTLIDCIDNSVVTGSLVNTNQKEENRLVGGALRVSVMPNPSPSHFTLQVASARGERVTIRVMDMLGRVVETKVTAANANLQVGRTLRPGTYLAEVVQGSDKQTLKLVKTGAF